MGTTLDLKPADDIGKQVVTTLRLYRKGVEMFGSDLFSDPGWNLLLELFAAKLGGRKMGLADLGATIPESTLARWIIVLEQRALISCRSRRLASGNFWVELTPRGVAKMSALFDDH